MVLGCLLGALLLDVFIELLYRQSLAAFWAYLSARPIAFLVNVLILMLGLSLCLFTKRKWFYAVLVGAVWAGLGIANRYVLSYRFSPLSAIDFAILQLDWSFIGIYMSVPMFILLVVAVVLLLVGLVLLYRRSPRSSAQPRRGILTLCILILSIAFLPELPVSAGFGGNAYTDVINLTEQYGFVYTFSRSLIDVGIDCPEDYSARRIHAIAKDVLDTETNASVDTPNILFLQLESFFDVAHLQDVEFSEDPVPFFRQMKANGPSGFFTAPSVGAGTANTEFEVMTQMNVHDFGTGEYPYKTLLQNNTCESIAYNLKDLGLSTHVLHNNTATFYDRDKVFSKLGFDSFTSIEYMNNVEYNEIGWAKDSILTEEILDLLASTDTRDLIYTISVQPHGAYPQDSETATIEVVSGVEDEALRGELEYYATQLKEVDDFLRALTEALGALDEPVVLVVYGDHMPSLAIDETMLDDGSLYTTEYAVWANFELEAADKDVCAYQLVSHVFEMLGINNGTLTKFHQLNDWSGAYETELYTLQYDMLYGDRVVYGGENPFVETDMQFGTRDIVLYSATVRGDTLTAHGENFTPYSVIYLDGAPFETTFVSETEITCTVKNLPADTRVSVWQVAEDGTMLSSAVVKE